MRAWCSPAAIARQSPRVSARRRLHAAMAAVGPTSSLLGGPEAVRDSTVLVVGGGMSGLGAAATLVSAGVSTLLVEQGRGVGGRVCSRRERGPHGELSFDHLLAAAVARPGAGTLAVVTGTRAAPGSLRREGDSWLVSTHPKPEPGKTTITHHRVVIAAGSASSTFNVISPVACRCCQRCACGRVLGPARRVCNASVWRRRLCG